MTDLEALSGRDGIWSVPEEEGLRAVSASSHHSGVAEDRDKMEEGE